MKEGFVCTRHFSNAEFGKVDLVLHVPFFQICHNVVNHPL